MIVDPFVAGVFCTLFVELSILVIAAIINSSRKDR